LRTTLNITVSTKSVFFRFRFGWGGEALQPGTTTTPCILVVWRLNTHYEIFMI